MTLLRITVTGTSRQSVLCDLSKILVEIQSYPNQDTWAFNEHDGQASAAIVENPADEPLKP